MCSSHKTFINIETGVDCLQPNGEGLLALGDGSILYSESDSKGQPGFEEKKKPDPTTEKQRHTAVSSAQMPYDAEKPRPWACH